MAFRDFVAQHQACSYAIAHERPQGGTIVCSEKGKTYRYRYIKDETFVLIRVDDGLVQGPNNVKCDYLILNTTELNTKQPKAHSIFVELKNPDIHKACEQLLTMVNTFAKDLTGSKLHARIVVSKVHAPKISGLQPYQAKFSHLKCSFDYQSQTMTEHTGPDGSPAR